MIHATAVAAAAAAAAAAVLVIVLVSLRGGRKILLLIKNTQRHSVKTKDFEKETFL
jgi:hypothetical protein